MLFDLVTLLFNKRTVLLLNLRAHGMMLHPLVRTVVFVAVIPTFTVTLYYTDLPWRTDRGLKIFGFDLQGLLAHISNWVTLLVFIVCNWLRNAVFVRMKRTEWIASGANWRQTYSSVARELPINAFLSTAGFGRGNECLHIALASHLALFSIWTTSKHILRLLPLLASFGNVSRATNSPGTVYVELGFIFACHGF